MAGDYSHLDTFDRVQDACARGEVVAILLVPTEYGGRDILENWVYVPAFAAEEKARVDESIAARLVRPGALRRYEARPVYEGDSYVPSALVITASDPGELHVVIKIWGAAAA